MKLSEHHSDGHKPQGAPDQEMEALGVSNEGLVALFGGSAVAAGQNNLTTGLVQSFAEEWITYSIARGDAIFEPSTHSPESSGAVAAADTLLVVSHADFIIENERSYGGHGPNDAWAISELDYSAIDIKGWSPPGGTVVIDFSQRLQSCGHEPPMVIARTSWPWLRRTAPAACQPRSPTRGSLRKSNQPGRNTRHK
jgi:hypothetical protein